MLNPDTRLIRYDEASDAERPATLAALFDDSEELELARKFLEDPFARPILEFMLLNAVPFEGFVLLREHGYAEVHSKFATYVPAARGAYFPAPQLTEKARTYKIVSKPGRASEAFIEGLVLAYRARTTGQGIVAGRMTLEEWLDKGDECALSCVVDPDTGGGLEAWKEDLTLYDNLIDPASRKQLITRRAHIRVAAPMTDATHIHDLELTRRNGRKTI
jgi:hypothetical protein